MPESGAAPREASSAERSAWRRWWSSRRVVVRDESMLPTLRPGDRLLVDRDAYRERPPRVGEIVVLSDPEEPTRWLVKRVATVSPDPDATVYVVSDAPGPTRDSRRFGPVPVGRLIGRVYRRYSPVERRVNL